MRQTAIMLGLAVALLLLMGPAVYAAPAALTNLIPADVNTAAHFSPMDIATPITTAANTSEPVRLLAVNVGKGDALILQVGDWVGLIDSGKAWARGRVLTALERLGISPAAGTGHLDAVFLTHTDDDHGEGFAWLAEEDLAVDAWYASAMYIGVKEKKHPATAAAKARGQEVHWLQRGDAIPLGDTGAVLRVLAPASLFTDKDDNNSLVMMLECSQGRILLTGDMELPEEAELLGFGDDLSCTVLKVANHGDDDTTSQAFARAASAQLAIISTDSYEKPDTPDPAVVERLESAGSTVLVTQDSDVGLLVTLSGGTATAQNVPFAGTPTQDLYIAGTDAGDDRITIGNRSTAAASLDGCYLYSDRGNELFAFPAGTTVPAGGTLVVGTKSTEGSYDVLWPDKKVIHKSKTDIISLYDSQGRLLSDSGY